MVVSNERGRASRRGVDNFGVHTRFEFLSYTRKLTSVTYWRMDPGRRDPCEEKRCLSC